LWSQHEGERGTFYCNKETLHTTYEKPDLTEKRSKPFKLNDRVMAWYDGKWEPATVTKLGGPKGPNQVGIVWDDQTKFNTKFNWWLNILWLFEDGIYEANFLKKDDGDNPQWFLYNPPTTLHVDAPSTTGDTETLCELFDVDLESFRDTAAGTVCKARVRNNGGRWSILFNEKDRAGKRFHSESIDADDRIRDLYSVKYFVQQPGVVRYICPFKKRRLASDILASRKLSRGPDFLEKILEITEGGYRKIGK